MFFNMSLFCLLKYSEILIQSFIAVLHLSHLPLAAPNNISRTRTVYLIHDPQGIINFSNRGVTGFGI